MNRLNEMEIAELKDNEVASLMDFEKDLNQKHQGEELYVMVLKK